MVRMWLVAVPWWHPTRPSAHSRGHHRSLSSVFEGKKRLKMINKIAAIGVRSENSKMDALKSIKTKDHFGIVLLPSPFSHGRLFLRVANQNNQVGNHLPNASLHLCFLLLSSGSGGERFVHAPNEGTCWISKSKLVLSGKSGRLINPLSRFLRVP